MSQNFRPEFLNRIDEMIIFHALLQSQLNEIVQIQVKRLEERLNEQKMALKLSPEAVNFLSAVGYDPVYGARPLKRAIQRHLETPIAKAILRSEFKPDDVILVEVKDERLSFQKAA